MDHFVFYKSYKNLRTAVTDAVYAENMEDMKKTSEVLSHS